MDYLKEIFCSKPILQFPDPNKNYVLYTDASNNAYSSVLCQPQDNENDIRPVAYFSGTFTAQNKSWCATEKEAYVVLKSVQRFNYYLRGAQCTLRCDHKTLEPFLSRGMKIAKLDRWAMLLQEYDIKFINIKGKDNILADAISRFHILDIYEDPANIKGKAKPTSVPENVQKSSKTQDEIELIDVRIPQWLLNITTKTLKRLQKQDKFCKRKVHEITTGTSNDFCLNSENILKRIIVVNHLEVNTTVISTPIIYTLLHEYHNCKGHQGSARTFNMLKHEFWWKGVSLVLKIHPTLHPPPTAPRDTKSTFCMHSNRHHW